MFVVRQAVVDDHPTLLRLAKTVRFLNLPPDPDVIRSKIIRSRKSFTGRADQREREFMFVLEDTDTGNVIGTSSILSCVSWPGHPATYLQMRRRELYSDDLQTGHVHVTLQIGVDETGPTELASLVLAPSYRGHREHLGSILSFVRFHYIGLHRAWFAERITSELMPPLTPDSNNTLWEYLGRRFINLSYIEADRFSLQSKEFVTSLFPKEEIYVSLLPPEARNIIGKVSPETKPARAMLERLGFRTNGRIDPFDGGPHLEANRDDITLVRGTTTAKLGKPADDGATVGLVSFEGEAGFRAARARIGEQEGGRVSVPKSAMALIGANEGDVVGVTRLASPRERTSEGEGANVIEAKPASS